MNEMGLSQVLLLLGWPVGLASSVWSSQHGRPLTYRQQFSFLCLAQEYESDSPPSSSPSFHSSAFNKDILGVLSLLLF